MPFDARSLTKASAGKLQWATKMVDVFMKAQSEIALGTAYMIASHDRVWGVSPTAPGGRFELDAHEEIASLRGLGVVEARHRIPHLRPVFFSEPVESFRPIHQLPG